MTRHTSSVEPKSSGKRGSIAQCARELGVTREHLSRVLNGHRQSRSLTKRYNELKASKTAEQTNE